MPKIQRKTSDLKYRVYDWNFTTLEANQIDDYRLGTDNGEFTVNENLNISKTLPEHYSTLQSSNVLDLRNPESQPN